MDAELPPELWVLYVRARAEVAAAVVLVAVLALQTVAAVLVAAGRIRLAAVGMAVAGVLVTQLPGLPSRPLGALTCAAAVWAVARHGVHGAVKIKRAGSPE